MYSSCVRDVHETDSLHALITPRVYRAELGGSVLLNCTVRGTPLLRIEWLHNQRPVHSQYAGGSTAGGGGLTAGGSGHDAGGVSFTYAISNARQEHRGVYQCFAYNDEESTQASAILDITGE